MLLTLVQSGVDRDEPAAVDPLPIVVTASRDPDAPVPGTSRIGQAEITALQPAALLDAIDRLAGVRAFSVGGVGGGSFLSVRGGEPNFTLVTVEGLKLNNPTNSRGGAFDFTLVDPALVSRVEVVRGAASPIHGADALSGLVAIRLIAPAAGELAAGGRAVAGSQGELGLSLRGSAGWNSGSLLGAVGWYDSGDLDLGSDLERDQQLLRVRQRVGGFALGAVAIHARARRATFPEDSGGPLLAVNREREQGELSLIAALIALRRDPSAWLRPNLSLSWSEQRDRTATPAIAPGIFDGVPATAVRSRFRRFEAIADVGVTSGAVTAVFGGALLAEQGRSRGALDLGFPLPTAFDLDRITASAFAEATFRPSEALSVNVSGRIDAVEDGPRSCTGRAAGRLRLGRSGVSLLGAVGNGYKLPSFFALAHPLVGNPDLRPERSTNVEAGVEWDNGGRASLRVSLFRNRFRNLVDFDASSFRFVNRAQVVAAGVEAEGRWRAADGLELSAGMTLLDLDTATPLRARPRWDGAARVAWAPGGRLELSTALRINSAFFDASIPTGVIRVAGHAEADLDVGYRLTPSLRFGLTLRNVTASRYQDAVGFPAAGRLVRASVSAAY